MFCFYTATRGIHTYQVSDDGLQVSDPQPFVDERDRILRFGAPLDEVHGDHGRTYVADFSAPERSDSGNRGGVWLVTPLKESTIVSSNSFDESSRGERMRNGISGPEPLGLGYPTRVPFGCALAKWTIVDANADDARRGFCCIPDAADGTIDSYAVQAGRSRNSIAFVGVPVPASAKRYRIEFRQAAGDNDYIGFVVGASTPAVAHNGIEFGYDRQLPGTDTSVDDAYLRGALGEAVLVGQALRKQWAQQRIEVDGDTVRWFQNNRLTAEGKPAGLNSGVYFGIQQKFERGTKYDDVRILSPAI